MSSSKNPLRAGAKARAPVLNIAHRGARAFAPENTICAFEKAAALGCPMFETDVHLSRDGELIVHHDDELTRCTDVEAKFPNRPSYHVSDFTSRELRRLDAGSWYVRQLERPAARRQPFLRTLTGAEMRRFVGAADRTLYASGAVRIPTLREALEVAQRTGMMVNIEVKTLPRMYAGLSEALIRSVAAMDMEDRVLVSSFDHEQLRVVRRLSRRVATGVLTGDRLARPGDYLRLLDADAYNPGCYGDYDSMGFGSVSGKLDTRAIGHARAGGFGVHVWTCNDKSQMRQLIAAGVTGIITDFPNRLREVLAEISPGGGRMP